MAKGNTTTVTHADGTVDKRTSVRATYTHAVVLTETRESIAAYHRARQAENERYAAEYDAAAVGEVTRVEDGDVNGYMGVRTTQAVGGVYVASQWRGGKGRPADETRGDLMSDEAARDKVREYAADRRVEAAKQAEIAAKAEAGPEFRYSVLRWSSREDLAVKAASGEFSGMARNGATVTVVPVDAK